MAGYDMNVYYNPEKHELEPLLEWDYSDGKYCFDKRVVWRHKPTGKLYTARDRGCSCPSPFEDYNGVADLSEFNADVLIEEIREVAKYGWQCDDSPATLITNVRELR